MRAVSLPKKVFTDPSCKTFQIKRGASTFQGFVVHVNGLFFAYENLCKHLPVSLDFGDGAFFSHDLKHLQCHRHGAIYEIANGECVDGPCVGKALNPLALEVLSDRVIVKVPNAQEIRRSHPK